MKHTPKQSSRSLTRESSPQNLKKPSHTNTHKKPQIKALFAHNVRTQTIHEASMEEFAGYEMELWYRVWTKNQVLIVTVAILTLVALVWYVFQDRSDMLSANILDTETQDPSIISTLDQDDLPIQDPMQFHQ